MRGRVEKNEFLSVVIAPPSTQTPVFSMKSLFLPLFLLISLFPITALAESGGAAKPNIVLLLADDMGYGDLSCYGSEEIASPNLDQLAKEGMLFTDFYAASGVCSPSRAAVLSGRFPVRMGVYSWISHRHPIHLRQQEVTIAELLKGAGYATAHIGKWHLGGDLDDDNPAQPHPGYHGFDYWMATVNNASPSHENPKNFYRNGESVGVMEGFSSQLVVDEAMKWLEENLDPEVPFYLNLWFHEPHQPVAAPPEFRERHLKTKNPDYYGCIENMDDAIGRLLERLDEMGVRENTLIIFASDNGSYMRGSNKPLHRGKTSLWEGGIRVPGIISWPGKVPAGVKEQTPAGLVDLLPTICEAAGVRQPADRTLDGVSLMPLFRGNELQRNHPLYWFYTGSRPIAAMRQGPWSLIADPTIDIPTDNLFQLKWIGDIKSTGLTNFRLYNLREDIAQRNDVAAENPKVLEELKETMQGVHREVVAEAPDWRDWPE